jgi:hypothetical protein
MSDLKELFFSKFNICTNFDLDLDVDTINELLLINNTILKNNHKLYSFLQALVNKFDSPFIFYYGIKNIEALDKNKIYIYQNLRRIIKEKGLNFYLFEPLTTYHTTKEQKNWYCEYDKDDEAFIKSQELDSIENFCKTYNLKSVTVYSAEFNIKNIFENKYKRLNLQTKSLLWPFKNSDFDNSFCSNEITKKFWCGNKRYSAHRHVIASYLISTVSKEMLNISWFCNSNINDLTNHIDINLLGEKKSNILKGVTELDNIAPITFDTDLKSKLSIYDRYFIDFDKQNTKESYKESFCAVITETRFFQNTSLISEKIINPLLNKKFFIVAGPPKTLQYLRSFGLKTFNDWIDESYDDELDHIARLKKILNIIDYINSKDIKDLQLMYKEMQETILYNLNTLRIIKGGLLKNW